MLEEACWIYWCPEDSEMRHGSNQHNNQLIYYIRDIKVVGPAHSSALDDLITGEDISCCGGVFWGDDTQHTTTYYVMKEEEISYVLVDRNRIHDGIYNLN